MADDNGQLELAFPNPDEFPSYDDVESDEGQDELPADSFDETSVAQGEDTEACGCVQ